MVLSLPRRQRSLEIIKLPHKVIVHDKQRDYVHILNHRAAAVLEHCDGTRSCAQIAQRLALQSRTAQDGVAGEVAHLVAEFADLALIESANLRVAVPV